MGDGQGPEQRRIRQDIYVARYDCWMRMMVMLTSDIDTSPSQEGNQNRSHVLLMFMYSMYSRRRERMNREKKRECQNVIGGIGPNTQTRTRTSTSTTRAVHKSYEYVQYRSVNVRETSWLTPV
jgi:hypothetical protein